MTRFSTISTVILALIFVLQTVTSQECGSRCTESYQCRTRYCRDGRCIRFGDSPNDVGRNPCSTVYCESPYKCVLEQVRCVKFPCPPIAECVYVRRRSY